MAKEINYQKEYYKRQHRLDKARGIAGLFIISVFAILFVGACIIMF